MAQRVARRPVEVKDPAQFQVLGERGRGARQQAGHETIQPPVAHDGGVDDAGPTKNLKPATSHLHTYTKSLTETSHTPKCIETE